VAALPERDIRFYSSSPATDTLTLVHQKHRVNFSRLTYRHKKPPAAVSSPARDAEEDERMGIALRAPDAALHNKVE